MKLQSVSWVKGFMGVVALAGGISVSLMAQSSETAGLRIHRWTAVQSGWLYVLDPVAREPRIWVMDPERWEIRGEIETGQNPDLALLPDGSSLYVSAGVAGSLRIWRVDTQSGKVEASAQLGERSMHKVPLASTMAMTPEGQRLLIQKVGSLGVYSAGLNLIREDILVPQSSVVFVGSSQPWIFFLAPLLHHQVQAFEISTGEPWRLRFATTLQGKDLSSRACSPHALTERDNYRRAAWLYLNPRSSFPVVLMTDGSLYRIDPNNAWNQTEVFEGLPGRTIPTRCYTGSSDGRRVYFGSADLKDRQKKLDRIHVVDTEGARQTKEVAVSTPFWSLNVSGDERWLYAATGRANEGILVVDLIGDRVYQRKVGTSPSLVWIAP
ncbi:MAG: hypothetical protein AB1898_07605 [Acidobacteriota bacterium]